MENSQVRSVRDNAGIHAKLELRREYLKNRTPGPLDVFDCCQGSKLIWGTLQKEFALRTYFGVDVKKQKGRIKVDSARVLAQRGWDWNVIDVDTYGSPWKHFVSILENARHPVTVFLTIGKPNWAAMAGGNHTFFNFPDHTPASLRGAIPFRLDVVFALDFAQRYGTIESASEAEHSGAARYLAVRFRPKETTWEQSPSLTSMQGHFAIDGTSPKNSASLQSKKSC